MGYVLKCYGTFAKIAGVLWCVSKFPWEEADDRPGLVPVVWPFLLLAFDVGMGTGKLCWEPRHPNSISYTELGGAFMTVALFSQPYM